MRTLVRWRRAASRDRTFIVWEPFEGDRQSWTYGEFICWVERFAAGLTTRGVRPGDRLLIHMDNCPEFLVAWLGCAVAGVVAVTTNARSSAEELSYYCDNAGVVAAVTQPKFAEMVASACRDLRWRAITANEDGDHLAAGMAQEELFSSISADPSLTPPRAYDPGAAFSVQYTSGTTSRPKGVVWTHANALWGAQICAAHEGLREDDVHLTTMPLFHTNAQAYSVLAGFWVGATVVLQPRFSASRFWPIALKHRCTWTSMVPFCLKALETVPAPERHDFRLWGNAYCSPPQDAKLNVKTIGWWGMTETISHGFVGLVDRPNAPMSMGRAAPEYEIRVLNDRGAPAEPGEVGDLAIRGVRGLSLFAEYLGNPATTADAFDRNGFFLTGDRVHSDTDGFYYFADRAKDVLKVGGENVSAAEIERVILACPGVREVAVVAKPHPMLDEAPVAFIVPSDHDVAELIEQVARQCRANLADFKQPHEIRLISDLPRSTLEKVAKSKLRALLIDESASGVGAL